ncbi:zinc ribbon domain-containing protein [Paenibacillus antarcticus]|uniref:Uncharacterized protein n=1 Tax=Paenibacillus antarcticus TaxID=253703 RepID=A0A168MS30_9BACL|nr:zinc ribbon domain-containing protein [Paenibacillus antarcticus]OAB44985.1 hypothetical protein PBAT_13620 [Paenibacillus antarcticus]
MAVKICSKCGESNRENATVCVVCSNTLSPKDMQGTLDSEKEYSGVLLNVVKDKSQRTTCAHCKEQIEYGSTKCKYCGKPVTKSPAHKVIYTSDEYLPDRSSVNLMLFISTFFIPFVGIIVGGILAYAEDKDKQSVGRNLLLFGFILLMIGVFISLIMIISHI